MDQDDFKRRVIRAVSGEASGEEIAELRAFLEKSPEHRAVYEETVSVWNRVSPPEMSCPVPDKKRQWAILEHRLGLASGRKRSPEVRTESLFRWFSVHRRALTAAVSLIAVSAALWIGTPFALDRMAYRSFVTGNGRHSTVQLPDGSSVLMNSGTSIRYPKSFSAENRRVRLLGEAFFRVRPGSSPFTIITENAVTVVLGTEFNVWTRDRQTRVTVREGKVRLQSSGPDSRPVQITSGLMSAVLDDLPPSVPVPADVDRRLGWMEGKLVFDETPVTEAVQELIRAYNVNIVVRDPGLNGLTITAVFDHMDIELVLESISLAIGAGYSHENGCYTLFRHDPATD